MADWKKLREEQAADAAERMAQEVASDYAAPVADVPPVENTPATPGLWDKITGAVSKSPMLHAVPYGAGKAAEAVGDYAAERVPAWQSAGAIVGMHHQAAKAESPAYSAAMTVAEPVAKAAAKAGGQVVGGVFDAAEGAGAALLTPGAALAGAAESVNPIYDWTPQRLDPKTGGAYRDPTASGMSMINKGASDVAALPMRVASWLGAPVEDPDKRHGLTHDVMGRSLEAMQGPGLYPKLAGLGGLLAPMLAFPDQFLAPGIRNPAMELAGLVGGKEGSLAAKLGVYNPRLPTVGEATRDIMSGGGLLGRKSYEMAQRMGDPTRLGMGAGGVPRKRGPGEAEAIVKAAELMAKGDEEKLAEYIAAGADLSSEVIAAKMNNPRLLGASLKARAALNKAAEQAGGGINVEGAEIPEAGASAGRRGRAGAPVLQKGEGTDPADLIEMRRREQEADALTPVEAPPPTGSAEVVEEAGPRKRATRLMTKDDHEALRTDIQAGLAASEDVTTLKEQASRLNVASFRKLAAHLGLGYQRDIKRGLPLVHEAIETIVKRRAGAAVNEAARAGELGAAKELREANVADKVSEAGPLPAELTKSVKQAISDEWVETSSVHGMVPADAIRARVKAEHPGATDEQIDAALMQMRMPGDARHGLAVHGSERPGGPIKSVEPRGDYVEQMKADRPQPSPQQLKTVQDEIRKAFDEVAAAHPDTRMVPIHEVRAKVAETMDDAAHPDFFDRALLAMRGEEDWRVLPISDRSRATAEQLQHSIPGVGDTLFYITPAEGVTAKFKRQGAPAVEAAPPVIPEDAPALADPAARKAQLASEIAAFNRIDDSKLTDAQWSELQRRLVDKADEHRELDEMLRRREEAAKPPAEAAAEAPLPPQESGGLKAPPPPATEEQKQVFRQVFELRKSGGNLAAEQLLKDAGLTNREYAEWVKGTNAAPSGTADDLLRRQPTASTESAGTPPQSQQTAASTSAPAPEVVRNPRMSPDSPVPIAERLRQAKAEASTNPTRQTDIQLTPFEEWLQAPATENRLNPHPHDPTPPKDDLAQLLQQVKTLDPEMQAGLYGGRTAMTGAREPRPITLPTSNIDYRGPYRTVMDHIKSLFMGPDSAGGNHPALRELVARGIRAEAETAAEIGPQLAKSAKAEREVRATGWNPLKALRLGPSEAVAPLVAKHKAVANPRMEFSGLTLAVDADAQKAAGLTGPMKFQNPKTQAYADQHLDNYHLTGQMAEDVRAMVRRADGTEVPFTRNSGGKMNAVPNVKGVPWMGKDGNPTYEKFLDDVVDANPGAVRDNLDASIREVRANPDRPAAYESLREYDVFPDWWTDPAGKRHLVNAALHDAIPVGKGGLQNRLYREALRAKTIGEWGQPEMKSANAFNLLESPTDPAKGLIRRINAESGDEAYDMANKFLAGLNGQADLAGIWSTQSLSHGSHWGAAAKEWGQAAADLATTLAGAKQLPQPLMETGHLVPGYGGAIKGQAQAIYETGKQWLNHLARGIDERLAVDVPAGERLAARGITHHDNAAETARFWQNTFKRALEEPTPNRPQTKLGKAWAMVADATTVGGRVAKAMVSPFKAFTETSGTINHATASAVDKYLGGPYAARAMAGKLREVDLIAMERQGIKTDLVEIVRDINNQGKAARKAGTKPGAYPGLADDLTKEWGRTLPPETQYMGAPGHRSPEIANDSVAKTALMFMRFSSGTGRKTFEGVQDMMTILANKKMPWTGADGKLDNLAYLAYRHAVRAGGPGTQLSGEMQRFFANRLYDREDTDLEKWGHGAGRMIQNALMAQFFGPLSMIVDYGLHKANIHRPASTRGGKIERATEPSEMLFLPNAAEKAIEATAPILAAPGVWTGALEKTPGHEDESSFKGLGKTIMSFGGPRQIGATITGPEDKTGGSAGGADAPARPPNPYRSSGGANPYSAPRGANPYRSSGGSNPYGGRR